MLIKLSDIIANPYRVFNLNPINEAKVEKLIESIEETGLWKIIVRRSPKIESKFELAFGHNRLEAAKRAGLKEADFDVQDLTNEQMIKMLARDNDEVYNSSMLSIVETVAATVQGLADGSLTGLEIPEKTKKEYLRYAPSFIPGEGSATSLVAHAYTPVAIGKLLGYTRKNGKGEKESSVVSAALDVLYLVQVGELKLERLANLVSAKQISDVTRPIIERLNIQRKRKAEQDKNEAERLRIEQEQKAFQEEREVEAKAAKDKQRELLEKQRAAEKEENDKAAVEAAEKRKKAEENEKLRTLKAHANAATKALRYVSTNVDDGAAIELAVHQANTVLEAKDTIEAVKITEKLSKLSRKVTDKFLEQQKAEQEATDVARKEMPTRNAVKALHSALLRIASKEDPLQDRIKTLARNPVVTLKERDILFHAVEDAQDRLGRLKKYFAKIDTVDILAEAYKKENAKRKLNG
jgi:ParB-like nuclease domain